MIPFFIGTTLLFFAITIRNARKIKRLQEQSKLYKCDLKIAHELLEAGANELKKGALQWMGVHALLAKKGLRYVSSKTIEEPAKFVKFTPAKKTKR